MILDVVVIKTDDGVTAEVPSLKHCECWAPDEETALDKIMDLAAYYLQADEQKLKLDKARKSKNKSIYKLVFDKSTL
jgi:hypothetical protein